MHRSYLYGGYTHVAHLREAEHPLSELRPEVFVLVLRYLLASWQQLALIPLLEVDDTGVFVLILRTCRHEKAGHHRKLGWHAGGITMRAERVTRWWNKIKK